MTQPLVFGNPNAIPQQAVTPAYGRREAKPVGAYINLSLPRTDGKDGKIDRGLRLYFDDNSQKELAQYLQTPEGIEWFKRNLTIQCNIVDGSAPKAGFAFNK